MTDLHPDDDMLLALALDDADDPDREQTLTHLSTCRRCRTEYDVLVGTVEQALTAAPNVEPSPGFDARALTAMGLLEPGTGRQRRRWQRWRPLAASVVVGLGLGAGAALALAPDEPVRDSAGAHAAALRTGDGERVGTVTRGRMDGDPVLVVTVTEGPVGMEYLCLLRLSDGEQVPSATWVLESAEGETWVLDAPHTVVTEVVLVANGGQGPVWSKATL